MEEKMSGRPYGSPPPYEPGSEYNNSNYAPSRDVYGVPVGSQPAYSYYPDDEVQDFHKWTSPPGIIKILCVIIVVMCVGIFACVASTLAWDIDMGYGLTGTGVGYSGFGSGSMSNNYGSYGGYGGYGFGQGIGGNYTDPRAAKGFIIAMAAICFIAFMAIFVIMVSRSSMARSRKFYLIVIIVASILAVLIFIATIVYLLAVNPVAQSAGSAFYNYVVGLCSQFNTPMMSGVFLNQYLYHYCVVEPQEAIAIVLGFLCILAMALIIFFAVKTRRKINKYGKMNIVWEKQPVPFEGAPDVEQWVNNVSPPSGEMSPEYPEKVNGTVSEMGDDPKEYLKPSYSNPHLSPPHESTVPLMNFPPPQSMYSSSSVGTNQPAQQKPPKRKKPGRGKRPDMQDCDADYTTGAESAEELEDEDWDSIYPPISTDEQRQQYKKEFDSDLQEYKKIQSEMENINSKLAELDSQLDSLQEGTREYRAVAEEYNNLKDSKKSPDYQKKKQRCRHLKGKLSHIKQKVGNYDSHKS